MAQSRQQNPPRSKAANPRFAADPNQSPPKRKNGGDHPTSGSRPRLPTDGTFGANSNAHNQQ